MKLTLSEYKESKDITYYNVHIEAGLYREHDLLFEKYLNEPSGNGWEGLLITYFEEVDPEFIKAIQFDCGGDEFFALTKSAEDQIKLTKCFLHLCTEIEELERILKKVPKDRRG